MKHKIINDSRGKQIGWSFAGKFFKHKADAPVSDPLPVFNNTFKYKRGDAVNLMFGV